VSERVKSQSANGPRKQARRHRRGRPGTSTPPRKRLARELPLRASERLSRDGGVYQEKDAGALRSIDPQSAQHRRRGAKDQTSRPLLTAEFRPCMTVGGRAAPVGHLEPFLFSTPFGRKAP